MPGIGNCGCETRDGRTQSRRMEVSTKQLQIAELAATRPEESFTSLNHYLDMDWMKEAYRRTRRESAPGVDGQTMEEYGKELESNLQELIGLAKSGRYQAPPVRRVHIPKGDGKETRPIGIPTVVSYCTFIQRPFGIGCILIRLELVIQVFNSISFSGLIVSLCGAVLDSLRGWMSPRC